MITETMKGLEETKKCIKCGEVKGLVDFSRDNRRADGRTSSCKLCHREYYLRPEVRELNNARSRTWVATHRDRINEYRKMNPDLIRAQKTRWQKKHRDAINKRRRAYRQQEQVKAQMEQYRKKNTEKIKLFNKKWQATNKGKVQQYYYERKQRLWQLKPKTKNEWIEMLWTLLRATAKAARRQNVEVLSLLKAKYEQLMILPS